MPRSPVEASPSSSTPHLYAWRARNPIKRRALRYSQYNTRAFPVSRYVEDISRYSDHDGPCSPPLYIMPSPVLPSSHLAVIQTDSNTQKVVPLSRPSYDGARLCSQYIEPLPSPAVVESMLPWPIVIQRLDERLRERIMVADAVTMACSTYATPRDHRRRYHSDAVMHLRLLPAVAECRVA
ncbi:hypothetical protein ARMGADRAFT_607359 [Armillaria gallica]|uniref:Uncharacterized protein n=1 Tax=Armillaria gallica TaxID=47427 RepID=A0A2H3CMX7_ARMGA|nr:hypothetical protein ARMGADRAFT_607359 [Armillaria gallica]